MMMGNLCWFSSFAQISADSTQKEQEKIMNLSKYQSIDYFATAREQKIAAKRGDVIVLQDDERRLYFGIVDTDRSFSSIKVVLYPKKDQREIVQATYDDLYYPRKKQETIPAAKVAEVAIPNFQTNQAVESGSMEKTISAEVEKAVSKALSRKGDQSSRSDSELEDRIERLEKDLEQYQLRNNQAAFAIDGAGRAYETSDILRYGSYASLFFGSVFLSAGGFGNSSSLQGTGVLLTVSSLGTGLGALVYRFKGHNKLKNAGTFLRK